MTEPFAWSDCYLLGHSAMDLTHEEFVACVAALLSSGPSELPGRLAAVADHLVSHFAQEDRWMAETGFPAAQCHGDEHAAVLRSLAEVQALFAANADPAVVLQFAAALADWFPGHADYMDAALSHWIAKFSFGGAPVVLRRSTAFPDHPQTQG